MRVKQEMEPTNYNTHWCKNSFVQLQLFDKAHRCENKRISVLCEGKKWGVYCEKNNR